MKANANKLLSALLACLLVLSACSSDQEKPADSNAPDATTHHSAADHQAGESPVETPKSREEKIQQLKSMIPEGLTKLPETAEEFYKLPPGRFAGVPYGHQSEEIKKVLRQFPNIENPDSESSNDKTHKEAIEAINQQYSKNVQAQ
jgi:Ca-activated chloride channel homolog